MNLRPTKTLQESERAVTATRRWVEELVVAYNLCPFARRELQNDRIRFALCNAIDSAAVLEALADELIWLGDNASVETTLLIHPHALTDFYDFNDFLNDCDQLLSQMELEGIFQIASFHPQYRFAGTHPEDPENYSNRSPFPMLHLLREDSVERAIALHPAIEDVVTDNLETLNGLGSERLRALWQRCLDG